MKNFNIFGGFTKKAIYRGNRLTRRLGQFADLGGGILQKRGLVFLRGVDTPMHTMTSSDILA